MVCQKAAYQLSQQYHSNKRAHYHICPTIQDDTLATSMGASLSQLLSIKTMYIRILIV